MLSNQRYIASERMLSSPYSQPIQGNLCRIMLALQGHLLDRWTERIMGPGGIYGLILENFRDWYLNHVEANRPILRCLFCLVIGNSAKVRYYCPVSIWFVFWKNPDYPHIIFIFNQGTPICSLSLPWKGRATTCLPACNVCGRLKATLISPSVQIHVES